MSRGRPLGGTLLYCTPTTPETKPSVFSPVGRDDDARFLSPPTTLLLFSHYDARAPPVSIPTAVMPSLSTFMMPAGKCITAMPQDKLESVVRSLVSQHIGSAALHSSL